MDYDELLSKVFNDYKKEIIINFQNFYKEGRPFIYSIDEIRKVLSIYRNESLIFKYHQVFERSIPLFNDHEAKYAKGSSISKIINNEILEDFNHSYDIFDINNDPNHELHNYSFDEFVLDLIKYDSLGRIVARLGMYSKLYELFFTSNNYKNFTIEKFEGNVEDSEIYKLKFIEVNPDSQKHIMQTKVEKILKNNEIKNIHTIKIIKSINNFNDTDKAFLIHLCLKEKTNIPLTEKTKLLLISKNLEDYSIFYEPANENTFYIKINKGLEYLKNKNLKIEFLNSLIEKLGHFDLPSTIKEVISIRVKINNYK